MNTIEALRILHDIDSLEADALRKYVEAKQVIGALLTAYDALVPLPDLWPEDAQWFTVDADGGAEWHKTEPTPTDGIWDTGDDDDEWMYAGVYLHWRLCKWPRPEAAND